MSSHITLDNLGLLFFLQLCVRICEEIVSTVVSSVNIYISLQNISSLYYINFSMVSIILLFD